MPIPTWKITLSHNMFRNYDPRGWRTQTLVVEAHTGKEAEEIAAEQFPAWRIVEIERLTGYGVVS